MLAACYEGLKFSREVLSKSAMERQKSTIASMRISSNEDMSVNYAQSGMNGLAGYLYVSSKPNEFSQAQTILDQNIVICDF